MPGTLFLIAYPNDGGKPKVMELTRDQGPQDRFKDACDCGHYRRVVLATPFQEGLPFTPKETI